MMVTDICRASFNYTDEWETTIPDIEKEIEKYNKSYGRFTSYEWGVWVTAYARANLFSGIMEFKYDYKYSDTDSLKCDAIDNHMHYIEKYNENCYKRLKLAMDTLGLNLQDTHPKSLDGKEHPMGVWDYEGCYSRFKTLGAKRYVTEQDGKQSITIAGLNKKKPTAYMIEKWGSVFDALHEGMYIPAEWTGKQTHKYIDEPIRTTVVDYLGNEAEIEELSGVHMSGCDFTLSLTSEYIGLLMNINEEDIL